MTRDDDLQHRALGDVGNWRLDLGRGEVEALPIFFPRLAASA